MSRPGQKVVIVGGGFAGLQTARALDGTPFDVTIVDRRNFHLFQPLLYQVATGGLSPADIASPIRHVLRRQANARVLLGEVVDLDIAVRRLLLADGAIPYDHLIVAAGMRPSYFGHDDWEPHAPSLKTVEDATEIRRRVLLAFEVAEREEEPKVRDEWLTFVVAGGGPTGVELAGAIAELARDTLPHDFRAADTRRARVILVEAGERLIPSFAPRLSGAAEAGLGRLGVEVRTRTLVAGVGPESITLKRDGRDEVLRVRTTLWAAGVTASPLGKILSERAGVELDRAGRVVVQNDFSVPGHAELFVVGDLAHYAHLGGKPLPGLAPVAMQEGRYVGRLLEARRRGEELDPFQYFDKGNLATIGRARAVAEIRRLRFNGFFAWLAWLFVHITYLIDFENRVLVLIQWAWSYFTRNRSARLITGKRRDQPP